MENTEYTLLGKMNFKGDKFNIYSDNAYGKFYLKIIDSEESMDLAYPTLEEFISLNKIFGINYIDPINYDINENKQSNKLSKYKKVEFIPKVMTKTGLVSLAAALILSGCGPQNVSADNMSDSTTTIVEVPTKRKTFPEMTDEEIYEYFGYSTTKITDDIFLANERYDIKNEKYIVCKSVEEFKKYTKMEGKASFNDLLNAIENNETITGRYKDWFEEAINNLSKNEEFKDADFSVLLYNIQRMKVVEETHEQIEEESKPGVEAYFNRESKKVAINPDTITNVIFLHEVLGHASTQVTTEDNICFGSEAVIAKLLRTTTGDYVGDFAGVNFLMFGDGLEEGKADALAEVALEGLVESTSIYDIEKETFREFKETLGLTWSDIINNSMTLKMICKMEELKMNDSIKYIDNSDILYHSEMFDDFDDSVCFENNMGQFLLDYAQSQIEAGKTKQDVENQISQMIQKSHAYEYCIGISSGFIKDATVMKKFEENVLNSIEKSQNINSSIDNQEGPKNSR